MTSVSGVARLQREHRRLQQADNQSGRCLTAAFEVPSSESVCYHDPPYDKTNCQTGARLNNCRWETAKMRDMNAAKDGLKGKCVTTKGSDKACGCWREHLGACSAGAPNPVSKDQCEAQSCFWDENYTQPKASAPLPCRQLGPCIEGQEGAEFNKYCWKRFGDGPAESCAAMQACPEGAPADHNCHKERTDLKTWFTKEMFDDLFFKANLGYGPNDCSPVNYEAFMIAARYFPSFANEHYDSDPMGLEFEGDYSYDAAETHRRDLAAFFAHGIQETGENDSNFFASSRAAADTDIDGNNFENWNDEDAANCFMRGGGSVWFHGTHGGSIWKDAFKPEGGERDPAKGGDCANQGANSFWSGSSAEEACYAGRGPLQLVGSANNYGPFNDFLRRQGIKGPDGKLIDILAQPNLIMTQQNPPLFYMSAMWYYMTPQNPKWAMHDVVIGNWVATKANQDAGFYGPIFGPTNLIINGETQAENDAQPLQAGQASRRIKAFRWYNAYFGVTVKEPKKTLSAHQMPDQNAVSQMPIAANGTEFCRTKTAGATCSHVTEAACTADASCQWISMIQSWAVRGNQHKPRECIGWDNAANKPKPANDEVCMRSSADGGFGSTGPSDAWWPAMDTCNKAAIDGDANNGCRWTMEHQAGGPETYAKVWQERPCDCTLTKTGGGSGVWAYPPRSEGGFFSDRLAEYNVQNKAFCEISVFKRSDGSDCGWYPESGSAGLAAAKLCWLSPTHPQGCVNDGETCFDGTKCTSVREEPADSQEEGTCMGIVEAQDDHCGKYAENKYFCQTMAVTKDLCVWVKEGDARPDGPAPAPQADDDVPAPQPSDESDDSDDSAPAPESDSDEAPAGCPAACTTQCSAGSSGTDCNLVWNGICNHAAIGQAFGTDVFVSQYGYCGTGAAYASNARATCTGCNPNGSPAPQPESEESDEAPAPQPESDESEDAPAPQPEAQAGSCPTACKVKCSGGDTDCNNQWNGKCDHNVVSQPEGTKVFVSQWGWCGTSAAHESNNRAECTACDL